MKSILYLLLSLTIALFNCQSQQQVENKRIPDLKTEIEKVSEVLKKYEEPSQTFKVSSDKPVKIKGKQGTIIQLDPTNLVNETGQPLGESIEVELKELTCKKQLLRSRAQTVSNGKLLVSGGTYYINLTSGGQQLKLKDGKTLSVIFPKLSREEMTLFSGQRDSLGLMNWQECQEKFVSKVLKKEPKNFESDSISSGEMDDLIAYVTNRDWTPSEKKLLSDENERYKLEEKVYKAIQLQQLGWINCDRFLDFKEKTNLQFTFNKKDSIISAKVYLVFEGINSLMENHYFSFNGECLDDIFRAIPVDAKVRLIAISVKNGKTLIHKSFLKIRPNETITLSLKESNKKTVEKLFQ
jgi:hypothetical protein